MTRHLVDLFHAVLLDAAEFSEAASQVTLRSYQHEVACAVVKSVIRRSGLSFVVMFPRQSGKNELQAQIEAYLLRLFSVEEVEIVKLSPTWKPQSLNAMHRLQRVLERNLLCRGAWQKESGYIYRMGRARISFLSGGPETSIVGATGSTLLEVDEAQDILPDKNDKEIAPMAASTYTTRIFRGTAWTSNTLLARELRAAWAAEQVDGIRRVFVCTASDVAAEVPAYGEFVVGQLARLGRNHPMIRSQFFSEEIDGQAGLFPPERRALMRGQHLLQRHPLAGRAYAFTLDAGGEDRTAAGEAEAPREPDATALTIFEVDLAPLADPLLRAPLYRVVDQRQWVGEKQPGLYAELLALAARAAPAGDQAGVVQFLGAPAPFRRID